MLKISASILTCISTISAFIPLASEARGLTSSSQNLCNSDEAGFDSVCDSYNHAELAQALAEGVRNQGAYVQILEQPIRQKFSSGDVVPWPRIGVACSLWKSYAEFSSMACGRSCARLGKWNLPFHAWLSVRHRGRHPPRDGRHAARANKGNAKFWLSNGDSACFAVRFLWFSWCERGDGNSTVEIWN